MTLTKQSIEPGYTHPEPSSNGFVSFLIGASITLLFVVLLLIPLTLLGFETPVTNPVLLVFLFVLSIVGIAWSGTKMTHANHTNQISEQSQFKAWAFKRYGLNLTTEQLELLVMGQGVVFPNADGVLERYSLRYDPEREESFLFSEKELTPIIANDEDSTIVDASFELFTNRVSPDLATVAAETNATDVTETVNEPVEQTDAVVDSVTDPIVTVTEETSSVVEETPQAVAEVKPARQPRKRNTTVKPKTATAETVTEKTLASTVEDSNPAPKRRGRPPKAAVVATDAVEAVIAAETKPVVKRAPAKRTASSTKTTGATTVKPRSTAAKKPAASSKTTTVKDATENGNETTAKATPVRKPRTTTGAAKPATATTRKPAAPRKPRTKPASAEDGTGSENTDSL